MATPSRNAATAVYDHTIVCVTTYVSRDGGARRRYATCMRESGKDFVRYPMSHIKPQYARPLGPHEYAEGVMQYKAKPVAAVIDRKRQSSMFRSTTVRFKEKRKPVSFAGDGGWNYTLHSHGTSAWRPVRGLRRCCTRAHVCLCIDRMHAKCAQLSQPAHSRARCCVYTHT